MTLEDDKKQNADTQTAAESKTQEKAQGQEEQKQEQNNNAKKDEGEKVNKSVAQKGENGEIIFKNQDELDGFIARKYAQGAEKAEKSKAEVQEPQIQEQAQGQENQKQDEQTTQQEQGQAVPQDYLSTKVALAMAKAGVNAEKVERAARLVDTEKILENGAINDKKLEEEINAVISEFPELKVAKEEEKEEKGFKFGSTQTDDEKVKETKKSVPTKKWNRFNQTI